MGRLELFLRSSCLRIWRFPRLHGAAARRFSFCLIQSCWTCTCHVPKRCILINVTNECCTLFVFFLYGFLVFLRRGLHVVAVLGLPLRCRELGIRSRKSGSFQTTPLSVYFVDTIFPLFGQTNLWHALHWSVGHVPMKTFVRLFCRHKFSTFWSNQLVACLALVCGSRAHKDYFASSTLKFKIAKKTLGIFLGRKPTTNLLSISFFFWY
jgi:hypothetical protein